MNKTVIKEGSGQRALELWKDVAEARFKFKVYRATGDLFDDSIDLCSKMDPPGIFKILLAKKFKVERWEKFLKTMRIDETAQFQSENLEDCLQYMTVSKTLRDIKAGRQSHGCMGGMMQHSHAHEHKDEIQEMMENPEELTFEFTLMGVEKSEDHKKEIWAMNKSEQAEHWPKYKQEGTELFKNNDFVGAGEKYESALKCIDLLISAEARPTPENRTTKMVLLNNLAECLLRLDRWREAEKRAAEVLEIDENDQKALWRRGKARVRLLEVIAAKEDFNKLVNLSPSMKPQIQKELKKLTEATQERDAALKSGLTNMFK